MRQENTMRPVDIFHIGPQKAATTWVYECFLEHPEIACPPNDTIHYFDIHYTKGREWYSQFFEHARPDQMLFDPSYTYIRSPWAARRIASENPEAKIVLCLRNPIDRALSHYWHEKKKGKISFDFEEVTQNYDLFSSWIEPGLYAEHINRYLKHFSRSQILCLRYGRLKAGEERGFLRELFQFANIDSTFEPSIVGETVNEAGGKRTFANAIWRRVRRRLHWIGASELVQKVENSSVFGEWVYDRKEYKSGINDGLRDELTDICDPEIRRLEELLDLDLSTWRE